jgi:predicted GH43/DUF377 family glycosyl hydrolase
MHHEPNARNCWAPELFYDRGEDEYMIYWATTISGRFPETDSSSESAYNHRMYYCTTKNFENFSKTRLLYDRGFNVIDASIHKVNGEYIMFLKDETKFPEVKKNIKIARSQELKGNYSEASGPITGHWVEGPTAIKLDSGWMVYFDRYRQHHMGAVWSEDLVNWTDISDRIEFPTGTRHGTVFKIGEDELEKLLENGY